MAGWLALIAAAFQFLGPLLEDCLEERLKKAAKKLPKASSYATEAQAVRALCDAAILETRRPLVRRALRRLRGAAVEGDGLRTRPLTRAELRAGKKELADIRDE